MLRILILSYFPPVQWQGGATELPEFAAGGSTPSRLMSSFAVRSFRSCISGRSKVQVLELND